mgnify:FL=1
MQVELIDRFGLLEPATQQLFSCAELRLMAEQVGIKKIDLHDSGGHISFSAKPNIDPFTIIQLIQKNPKVYAMQGPDKLKIVNKTETGEQRVFFTRALLTLLGAKSS